MESSQTSRERSRTPSDDHVNKKPRLGSPEQAVVLVEPAPEDVVLDPPLDVMTASTGFGLKAHKNKDKKKGGKRDKKKKHKLPEPYSSEDVVHRDVVALLGQEVVDTILEEGKDWDAPFKMREEVELTVSAISSNGEYFI